MYYVNYLIISDLFQPSQMQKKPEPLWDFTASVNGFLSLMSNPLAFDFLLPLTYLLNDFLLLEMLLLVKSYLLYCFLCLSLSALARWYFCTHPMETWSIFSVLPFVSLWFCLISCFLVFLDFLAEGIVWERSSRNSQLPLAVFSHKEEKAVAWAGIGREKWRGGEDFGNRGLKLKFWRKVNLTEESKVLKTWKRWEGKEESLEREVFILWMSRSVETKSYSTTKSP